MWWLPGHTGRPGSPQRPQGGEAQTFTSRPLGARRPPPPGTGGGGHAFALASGRRGHLRGLRAGGCPWGPWRLAVCSPTAAELTGSFQDGPEPLGLRAVQGHVRHARCGPSGGARSGVLALKSLRHAAPARPGPARPPASPGPAPSAPGALTTLPSCTRLPPSLSFFVAGKFLHLRCSFPIKPAVHDLLLSSCTEFLISFLKFFRHVRSLFLYRPLFLGDFSCWCFVSLRAGSSALGPLRLPGPRLQATLPAPAPCGWVLILFFFF